MRVELENLTKQWGDVVGAEQITLDIQDGEFVAFLGPSGCGKTTTLLMVAGIYKPTAGTIRFDGRLVNQVPPKDRNIGMVFQSYALYPHMTVFQNISYPLKLKKVPKGEIQKRAQRVADMMGIGQLMDRKPAQLSGGQQQRVALGRALVKEPSLLLFDEPLSNLDARLRLSMRSEIKRLQIELGITSIYVTHDQVEAMTMADRIAVMKDGKLQAFAPPEELYDQPRTLFIAGFVGNPPMNLAEVEVVSGNGNFYARRPGLEVVIPAGRSQEAARRGKVVMGIRPEDMTVVADSVGDDPIVAGEVYVVEPLGRDILVDVQVGDTHFHVLTDPPLGLNIGDQVKLKFDTQKVQFFDLATEHSLLWS
ncbi:MAG: ABC transporter ATP-binding protein [Chloroflexi bacterium]|nr:ABC transporter ATP-binding protein [Chloroflexota bacterium]MCI0577981.1 ABC transporter ATP-binding protein [Chloroflexota bacterium]MCI0648091.1 ABC transporter ATP-binding protein [Chloroflexota bacterium]MCI0729243.1 ABC transporter ATP-binding protein [Chloroflexota bacterium]